MHPPILRVVKPSTPEQKKTHTVLDTIELTVEKVDSWQKPPFQRPLKINEKVRALVADLQQNGGVLPGIVTIGVLDRIEYLLDGQHRIESFKLSELPVGYTDVRYHQFKTMAEMSDKFIELNGSLVSMRPDDILHSMEFSSEELAYIRKECPFVGYEFIRRNDKAPILSMSATVRCWMSSAASCPGGSSTSAVKTARALTPDEAKMCVQFLRVCYDAWGREKAYSKLWGGLNLVLCAWLYRNIVLSQYSARTTKLDTKLFMKCLMSLSANDHYLAWLVGRNAGDRDRSPAYNHIKKTFAKRYEEETGKKGIWPSPSWASHSGA